MSLDATTLSDFRADMGDENSPYAFEDLEIERLFERASGDFNGAKVLAVKQLLANANKLYDYTAGFTKVSYNQIVDNLRKWLDDVRRDSGNEAIMVGLTVIPPKHRTVP